MKYCLITFRSVTPAQRGERLLRNAGFGCQLRRTPRWMEEQGCGYSLQVAQNEVARCVDILRGLDIPYRKVYCYGENGKMEAISL